MSTSLLIWLASGCALFAFGAFAWVFTSAIYEGSDAYANEMGAETSRAFEDIFMYVPAAKISRLGRLAAAATFFTFFVPFFSFNSVVQTVIALVVALGAAAFVFTLPKRYVIFLRDRRRLKFNLQLVDTLGTIANALRAGFSISQAFESVVENGEKPIKEEFALMLQQLRLGVSFEDALKAMDERVASDDLTLVVTSIDIARKTGGNLTEILDTIAQTIRSRMRIENRVRTLTAQGRFQGIIVSCLPLVLGVIFMAMRPDMMMPFVTSVGGIVCILIMFVLIIVGWFFIRKIIRIDV